MFGFGDSMFARITAKVVLATIAVAMAFFGIGLLGLALLTALVKALGPIGGYALLIAGHARSQGLIVVTNNLREFARMPGLRAESWV